MLYFLAIMDILLFRRAAFAQAIIQRPALKREGNMNEEIKKLLEILVDINEDVDFEHEKALVDDGLIDSFDITSIITALDEEFNIRIEASEIEPENFNSVESILETVKRYQAKR